MRGSKPKASACEPALVQAVGGFRRASQDSEETDEATAFMRQLQWELDRISRDLVACGITSLTLFGEGDAAAPQAESARTRRWRSRCTREPSHTHAVCAEQRAVLSSVGPPRRTRADVPLTALNCIVVFSATKVDKMVPAPAATLRPSCRRSVCSPTAASPS